MDSETPNEETPPTPERRASELGRKAGRLLRQGKPRIKRAVDEGQPRVKRAIEEGQPRVKRAIEENQPKVKQAIEQNRPRAEQAGRDAVRYAQDHQDELKSLALRGVRMRLGPLGMAMDALGLGGTPAKSAQTAQSGATTLSCSACQSSNPANAKFCNQCGSRLQPAE